MPMTYLLLLIIALLTVLALGIKQFQLQKKQLIVMQHALKEADKKIAANKQIHETTVSHLNNEINIVQNQLKIVQRRFEKAEHELDQQKTVTNEFQRLSEEKEKVRKAADDLYNDIEKEIEKKTKKISEKIQDLEEINNQLRTENKKLKTVKSCSEDSKEIFLKTVEKDLYPQERKAILIDVLRNSLANVHENSRRHHIISDIIANNSFESKREQIKNEIQSLFRDYNSMNSRTRNALERMGFQIVSESNNYKILFQGDNRYKITFAKTPSDWRAGRNITSDICNLLL
jgi:DNA repair exonuclease SbcCD ATPase subunit